ncbi:sensor histidine kinase, partial [Streptomonospora salina]|uniref:sensor histidine kinase n=1 Tax=Streptomonospora salina TaxID=104205 RepID=UPI0035E8A494
MTDTRRLLQLWQRLDVAVRDLPLGLLLLVGSFVPSLHGLGTDVGGLPDRPFDALAVVSALLQCLPLAVRRRWPALCLILVALGFALDQLSGYHLLAGTGLAVALLSAGAHLERYRRLAPLLLSAAYVPPAIALQRIGGEPPTEFVTFYAGAAIAWGIGAWLRSTRAAEAEHRRRVAEQTRTAERTSIARELHDVVTHHVTAMVVQAEAARYLTGAPERLDQALGSIGDTGRRATTDLRNLLDLLTPGHGPEARTPPAGRLLTLVQETRRAGQPVAFTEEGTPAESTGSADLVAYRVVQEALTNALKYAAGSPTWVRVCHGERRITVEVGTEGARAAGPAARTLPLARRARIGPEQPA